MCGIAGIFNPARTRSRGRLAEANRAMLEAMRFRGPDHAGTWSSETCVLGTARLSITGGLRRGNQPLIDDTGDVFVFNGELYEPEAISRREHLEYEPGDSDGVALASLLRSRGPEGLEGISAFFALALHDPAEQTLLLARDAYGQKPLYHLTLPDGTLVFASTIAALHVVAGPFTVRENAIDEYLLFKSVGGNASGFEGVEQLPPGGWMKIHRDGRIEQGRWNRLPSPHRAASPDPEELRSHLVNAVRQRIAPGFRPTVLLSGGLDSSIVAAAIREVCPPEVRPLALSIGYDLEGAEDETGYARRLADELDLEFECVRLPASDVPDLIEVTAGFLEDPVEDPITLPFLHLCGRAAAETKVVLTGDGSDEFWGGYERFKDPPAKVADYLARTMVFHPEEIGRDSFPPSYLESIEIDPDLEPLDRILRLEVSNRLRNHHLSRIDKLSMAQGLEARCPFLDLGLSRLALEIPARFKRDDQRVKIPLIEASTGMLPSWLLNRRKQPFTSPVLGWLQGSLAPRLQAMAHRTDSRIADRIDVSGLLGRFADPTRAAGLARRVWSLVFLETWLQSVTPRFARNAPEKIDAT